MSFIIFFFLTLLSFASNSKSSPYCQPISPPERGFVEINENYRYYKFFCEEGYILHGRMYIYCHEYRNQKPICIKHMCEDVSNPQYGQVNCDEGPLIAGKTCRFSCFNNYTLEGSRSIICKFNLQWSGSAICSPILKNSYSQPAKDSSKINQRPNEPNSPYVTKHYKPSSELTITDSCENLQCEQLCEVKKSRSHCRCCGGYILNTDKKTCRLNNPKNVNGKCLRKCKKYDGLEVCWCPEGYTLDSKKQNCIDINECNKKNFGCSNLCVNTPGSAYCACPNGFMLDTDNKTCIGHSSQVPFSHGPTSSLQSCSIRNGGCHHKCSMKDSVTIICDCRSGFQLHSDGKYCIDINECSIDNFGCSDSCVNLQGSAYCICPEGFTLDVDRKTCIDIDECSYENGCQHYCNNTVGSYFCSCRASYILIDGHKCLGCRKNSYWSYEKNACVDCPKNSHTDSEGKKYMGDCVCDAGYKSSPGDNITCADIDECNINNFDCSHKCINIPGSAYCICPKGFMLDADSKTCIDINECSIKNGGCEGPCINTEGSFNCVCPEGFISSNRDLYSCDDIDECSENNGGCEHLCINYRGGFFCACKEGYRLDSTLRNCTGIQCPEIPVPHYAHMDCRYKNMSLPVTNSYPAGTTCVINCNKGFKNIQDGKNLKCRSDGTWKGTLPECKSRSCPSLNIPENGEIHPNNCSTQGATVKQKCTFSCHAGYRLEGFPVFVCKNNLTWNKEKVPICKLVKIPPTIKCPQDIQVTLLQGEAKYKVTVPEPTTNVKYYEIHPSWVTVNEPVEFPVGETKVTFTAISTFNETAHCEMDVSVLDKEPPTFHFCPDPIVIEGARGSGEFVTWDQPVVTDNVELTSVFSLLEPNKTLSPGTYFVEYIARDSSGNIARCSFDISIIRMNCSDLKDPSHGKVNCMDSMFGKLCHPECDDGYMRHPDDTLFYSCDYTGVWEPIDFVRECLRFTPASSPTCQDGFEYKKVDTTEEEVCIECHSDAVWSPTTKKCEK